MTSVLLIPSPVRRSMYAVLHLLGRCPAIMTKPDHNDAIESRIGLTVATAVQPMSVGLTRGSRYRVHSAQRGEGGLGVEAFRVAPSSDQEGRRGVGSYAEDTDQGCRCRPGEPFQLGLHRSPRQSWISLLSRQ